MRRAFDDYRTPKALALAICERVRLMYGGRDLIAEPASGDEAAFLGAARKVWPNSTLVAHDIRPCCRPPALAAGALWALDEATPFLDRVEMVIGNPPFNLAEDFLESALQMIDRWGVVAFLLRKSFFGSARVRPGGLFARIGNPAVVIPVDPRPSYVASGQTDFSDYELGIWRLNYHGSTEWLLNEPILWIKPPRPPRRPLLLPAAPQPPGEPQWSSAR